MFKKRDKEKDKVESTHDEIKDARTKAAERAEMLLKQAASSAGTDDTPQSERAEVSQKDWEALKAQVEEWAALKERWVRQAADFENAKKRLQREKEEFVKFAHQSLVSDLLPIIRNLDRVVHHGEKQNGKKDPIVSGVELIIKQIHQLLEANGVKRINALGKPFDPHVHEAVQHIESDKPAETVIEEAEPGYLLHERLIQPAKVVVSKGKAGDEPGKEPACDDQSNDANPDPHQADAS